MDETFSYVDIEELEIKFYFKGFKNLFEIITNADDMRVVVGQDEILRELKRYAGWQGKTDFLSYVKENNVNLAYEILRNDKNLNRVDYIFVSVSEKEIKHLRQAMELENQVVDLIIPIRITEDLLLESFAIFILSNKNFIDFYNINDLKVMGEDFLSNKNHPIHYEIIQKRANTRGAIR